MEERPLICDGKSVRSILDDLKTHTRRVMRPQPIEITERTLFGEYHYSPRIFIWDNPRVALKAHRKEGGKTPADLISGISGSTLVDYCPHGKVGDRLWVRETWQLMMPTTVSYGGGEDDWDWESEESEYIPSAMPDYGGPLVYKADDENACKWWRPSIFMPKWASRIMLEITGVRVERLQDITIDDCKAEGIAPFTFAKGILSDNPPDPRWKFIERWNSINAKRGWPWSSNPWVWVVEFERVK